jgi:Tfp pilus assembly protein PilO
MSLVTRVFSERRAVLVPLTIFLVGNLLVLGLVVWPLQRAVAGAEDARFAAAQRVTAARKLEADAKAQRASKERADVELRQFYGEILPKDFQGAVKVTNFALQRLAEESRVMLRSGQWDPEPIRDSRLSRMTGQVTLIGDYANIRRFLYEVETAQEFVIIESVELSQATVGPNESQLELQLKVATYYLSGAVAGVTGR